MIPQSYFVQKGELTIPQDASSIIKEISNTLKENFNESSVEMVNCPDLREFGCSMPGIGGEEQSLLDIGGVPNLMDPKRHERAFDVARILKTIQSKGTYVMGAASGAKCDVGVNSELAANFEIKNHLNNSRYCFLSV